MWICTNTGFFSIVDKAKTPGCLVVRARRKGDIEKTFGVDATETVGNDYLYRAEIPRKEVARVVAEAVESIDYSNFKDSVDEIDLHDAYMGVWHVMAKIQPIPPYGRRRPAR